MSTILEPTKPEVVVDALPVIELPRRTIRMKMRSTFLVALVLFGMINAFGSFSNPIKFDAYKYSYKGWAWWTFNDLRNDNQVHNVAVLGSSLMVSAVAGCDANYLQKQLDLTQYHRATYLEHQLQNNFGGKFSTYNLSAPGQMPSDALLMLKAMTLAGNRPDVVVYGVAPRDFIDSTLSGPNDTEPFRYLSRIVNIDDLMTHQFRSVWGRLDWFLQKVCYFYNYSMDFRLWFGDSVIAFCDKYLPAPWTRTPFTWWDRVKVLPGYLPGEMHPAAVMSNPIKRAEIKFTDNTEEYKRRYKLPDPETFHTQMYFLRKLAEYCHRERIELILVNMPITYYNAHMLPAGAYENYVAALRKFSWNYDTSLMDLCDFKKYDLKDFHDSVHLNAFGGQKLFDNLIGSLKHDSRSSTILYLSGLHLEKTTALAGRNTRRTF